MKPYYCTFEWKDRVITLCLVEEFLDFKDYTEIYMGYSVKLPQDSMNENLAKQISLGRAKSPKTSIWLFDINYDPYCNILRDRGIFKAIARNCERNIKNGTIVIKGIR